MARVEQLEQRRLLAAGDLDLAFGGGDGIVTYSTQAGSQLDRGNFVAVQPSGKVIVAGSTTASSAFSSPVDLLVTRFNADGTHDATFANNVGHAKHSLLNRDNIRGMAVQTDGKILVAAQAASPNDWAVIRFTADGVLDTGFGVAGVALLDIASSASLEGIQIRSDGKIYLHGNYANPSIGGIINTVARLTSTGTLDTTFGGGDGYFTQPNLSLINAALDLTFDGSGGAFITTFGRSSGTGQRDRAFLTHITADGITDGNFAPATSSIVELVNPLANAGLLPKAVVLDTSGRVTIAAVSSTSTDALAPGTVVFYRFNAGGQVDTTFNAAGASPGQLVVPEASMIAIDYGDMIAQIDGKVVFGGSYFSSTAGNGFQLVRVNADGTLDATFSGDGHALFQPFASPKFSVGSDLALTSDGDLVMSGIVSNASTDFDIVALRVDLGAFDVPAAPVRLEAGGVLRVVGTYGDDTLVLRRQVGLPPASAPFVATLNGIDYTFAPGTVTSIDVDLAAGNDTQIHEGGVPGGSVKLGNGNNALTLRAGNLANAGTLNILGGPQNDTVTLEMAAFTPVFFDGSDGPQEGFDTLIYNAGNSDSLINVRAGHLDDGGSYPVDHANVEHIDINGNFGFDTFEVVEAEWNVRYKLFGNDGNDTFNLRNGLANAVQSQISVDGGAGTDSMMWDDSARSIDRNTTFNDSTFGNGAGGQISFSYVEGVLFKATSGNNSFFFYGTASAPLTIDAGAPDKAPGDSLRFDSQVTIASHVRTTHRNGYFTFLEGAGHRLNYIGIEWDRTGRDTTPPSALPDFEFQTKHSIAVDFDSDVYLSVDPSDLLLINRDTGATVATPVLNVGTGGPNTPTTAEWGFFAGQKLADGRYRATIPAGAITDYAGNALPALTFDFTVMAGDADGDADVDFDDLLVISQNYGQTGRTFSQGNFDYSANGTVGFDDLLLLAQAYGKKLPAMTLPTTSTTSVTRRRSSGPLSSVPGGEG